MGDLSLADIKSVMDGNELGGSSWIIILILFLLMFKGNGFSSDGIGQYATASSQQEILFGQQFDRLNQGVTAIGNGIADLGYSLNNSIINEGRQTQTQLCNGFAALQQSITNEGAATRQLITNNTISDLQSRLAAAEARNVSCETTSNITSNILSAMGRWVSNPPCYNYNALSSTCGCGCN